MADISAALPKLAAGMDVSITGGSFIVSLADGQSFRLSEPAGRLLQSIDGISSMDDLAEQHQARLGVSVSAQELWEYIDKEFCEQRVGADSRTSGHSCRTKVPFVAEDSPYCLGPRQRGRKFPFAVVLQVDASYGSGFLGGCSGGVDPSRP